ncbi:hypothetical protein KKH23_09845 [Patescibacteria group bacterium]|uniref:Putative capsid protein n=1 Tax=viral metagenome TaxID=1070528 RepID=A0A6M3MBY5_9ZZZZ|nr:hypothetical protein [Patescibacteria group bacterium]
MANLSNTEIQALFQERPRKKEIDIGIKHNDRLRFHTETVINKSQLSPYYQTYIDWISSRQPELLPTDKIERFKQLFTVPVPTVELTESIFSHLGNVFKGQDAFNRYQFSDDEILGDWQGFTTDTFWNTQGFSAMQNAIDSVWIVNLPEVQNSRYPEPEDRLIDIKNIIDISVDINNNCEYLIFQSGNKIYVYDDYKFSRYDFTDGSMALLPEVEIPHSLGYCPARMFWSDPLMSGNYINKKAPLTNVLGDLDWLLTCQVFKKYMEIANSYPITAAYRKQQNFIDSQFESDRGRSKEQQKTAGGALAGPGSYLEIDPPLQGESDLMADPVKLISPDVETLEFHEDSLQLKEQNIFYKTVGIDGEQKNDMAKNEKQVMASFESQSSILEKIAKNFEIIQEFADKTKINLRYGPAVLQDISVDYGSKFFLKTEDDYIEQLKEVKDKGGHTAVVSAIMDETLEAKYRNDKNGLTRAKIIQELDPLPDKTQEEAEAILDKRGITIEQFIIKSQLLNFVKRFEREQASLVVFASARDYKDKIDLIYDEFIKYAKEITENSSEPKNIIPFVEEPSVNEISQKEVLIK